jgi:hypothetical protein
MSRRQRQAHVNTAQDDINSLFTDSFPTVPLAKVLGALRHLVSVKDRGKRPNAVSWEHARAALAAFDTIDSE